MNLDSPPDESAPGSQYPGHNLQYWNEGVRAYNAGLSESYCPYSQAGPASGQTALDGLQRTDWIAGFNWAKDARNASR